MALRSVKVPEYVEPADLKMARVMVCANSCRLYRELRSENGSILEVEMALRSWSAAVERYLAETMPFQGG